MLVFELPREREPEAFKAAKQMRRAQDSGGKCGNCLRELTPTESLVLCRYMQRSNCGYHRMAGRAGVCAECAALSEESRLFTLPGEGWAGYHDVIIKTHCAFCERRLIVAQEKRRTFTCCSDACRSALSYRRYKEKHGEPVQLPCDICQEMFTPGRADGRYCSGKCRQKAYRQRNRL